MEGYLKLNYVGTWYMIEKKFISLFIPAEGIYLLVAGTAGYLHRHLIHFTKICPGLSESSVSQETPGSLANRDAWLL